MWPTRRSSCRAGKDRIQFNGRVGMKQLCACLQSEGKVIEPAMLIDRLIDLSGSQAQQQMEAGDSKSGAHLKRALFIEFLCVVCQIWRTTGWRWMSSTR